MTIDWMNPSSDVLEARRIGHDEGWGGRDEEVAALELKYKSALEQMADVERREVCSVCHGRGDTYEQDGELEVMNCPACGGTGWASSEAELLRKRVAQLEKFWEHSVETERPLDRVTPSNSHEEVVQRLISGGSVDGITEWVLTDFHGIKHAHAFMIILQRFKEAEAEAGRYRERLQFDPGGSDKIDELEQAMQLSRHDRDVLDNGWKAQEKISVRLFEELESLKLEYAR